MNWQQSIIDIALVLSLLMSVFLRVRRGLPGLPKRKERAVQVCLGLPVPMNQIVPRGGGRLTPACEELYSVTLHEPGKPARIFFVPCVCGLNEATQQWLEGGSREAAQDAFVKGAVARHQLWDCGCECK